MKLWPTRKTEFEPARDTVEISLDDYIGYVNDVIYNGVGYVTLGGINQTQPGQQQEPIGPTYKAFSSLAYKTDGVVFACMLTRALHFSEVRFQFRQLNSGRPGKLFGTQDLAPLEEPWVGGTTGDLLTRMLLHADLSGNAFVVRREDRLDLLRPDWVTIICGSNSDNSAGAWASDAEVIGYVYSPGGYGAADYAQETFLPDEVAHFAPIPDPEARFRGMSWLTPLIREVMADKAATEHKLRFFENPTPNMIVKFDVPDLEELKESVKLFKQEHQGARNAYKYMFMASGADATVVGSNLKDLDYKLVTGAGETRIAAAARTPPVIVGLSEGLQGSALNSGNYQSARRMFADGCIRPLWRNAAGSLAHIINVPGGSELWYDDRDVAFLKEDLQERAQVMQTKAQAARYLVDAGYKPDTVIDAIEAEDLSLLEHSGLFSVQLQAANAPKQGLFSGVPVAADASAAAQAEQQGVQPAAVNGNGRSDAELEALISRLTPLPPIPNETHVHFDKDAIQLVQPAAPDVHIHEGAIRNEVTTPEIRVEAPVTVEPAPAPNVEVNMDLEPVREGLHRLAERPTEIHVDSPVTVEAPNITVPERSVTVEAPNVEVTVPERSVTVEPANVEVTIPERAVTVEAAPAPVVNVTNEVPVPEVNVNVPEGPAPIVNVNIENEPIDAEVKFKRNPDGSLSSAKIKETGTDGS